MMIFKINSFCFEIRGSDSFFLFQPIYNKYIVNWIRLQHRKAQKIESRTRGVRLIQEVKLSLKESLNPYNLLRVQCGNIPLQRSIYLQRKSLISN